MHETSVVRSLLSQVLVAAQPSSAADIRRVYVSLGPLSGVEPVLVAEAFEILRFDYGLVCCCLSIELQELQAVCRECSGAFEVKRFVFRCPRCDSNMVTVTRGDEFQLVKIEVDALPELSSTIAESR